MAIFTRVYRTFVFLVRLFLVSCLFVCLLLFYCWFVWGDSQYGLQQIWAVYHELQGVMAVVMVTITITLTLTLTLTLTITITITITIMIITKNEK